ncbi:MAG: Crp/Fnr family transcriptional regulator [Comamonadaceae bacterium]|nr:MAG: Crp/Fnr family transcriptional regulator [Comamonadaceae bacterium]
MYVHPLLAAHVSDQERKALVKLIELKTFRRNEVVISTDEWTSHVLCVGSGLLRVTVAGAVAGAEVTTDFLRQDDFFLGDSMHTGRYQSGASLIAALPSSVYLVPVAQLHALCLRFPQLGFELMQQQVRRTQALRQHLRKVSTFPSDVLVGRIMHDLTHLAPTESGGYDKRITQAVIASFSGLSREQVNRILKDMEGRGLINKGGGGVEVPDDFGSTDFSMADFAPLQGPSLAAEPLIDDDVFLQDLDELTGRPSRPRP